VCRTHCTAATPFLYHTLAPVERLRATINSLLCLLPFSHETQPHSSKPRYYGVFCFHTAVYHPTASTHYFHLHTFALFLYHLSTTLLQGQDTRYQHSTMHAAPFPARHGKLPASSPGSCLRTGFVACLPFHSFHCDGAKKHPHASAHLPHRTPTTPTYHRPRQAGGHLRHAAATAATGLLGRGLDLWGDAVQQLRRDGTFLPHGCGAHSAPGHGAGAAGGPTSRPHCNLPAWAATAFGTTTALRHPSQQPVCNRHGARAPPSSATPGQAPGATGQAEDACQCLAWHLLPLLNMPTVFTMRALARPRIFHAFYRKAAHAPPSPAHRTCHHHLLCSARHREKKGPQGSRPDHGQLDIPHAGTLQLILRQVTGHIIPHADMLAPPLHAHLGATCWRGWRPPTWPPAWPRAVSPPGPSCWHAASNRTFFFWTTPPRGCRRRPTHHTATRTPTTPPAHASRYTHQGRTASHTTMPVHGFVTCTRVRTLRGAHTRAAAQHATYG